MLGLNTLGISRTQGGILHNGSSSGVLSAAGSSVGESRSVAAANSVMSLGLTESSSVTRKSSATSSMSCSGSSGANRVSRGESQSSLTSDLRASSAITTKGSSIFSGNSTARADGFRVSVGALLGAMRVSLSGSPSTIIPSSSTSSMGSTSAVVGLRELLGAASLSGQMNVTAEASVAISTTLKEREFRGKSRPSVLLVSQVDNIIFVPESAPIIHSTANGDSEIIEVDMSLFFDSINDSIKSCSLNSPDASSLVSFQDSSFTLKIVKRSSQRISYECIVTTDKGRVEVVTVISNDKRKVVMNYDKHPNEVSDYTVDLNDYFSGTSDSLSSVQVSSSVTASSSSSPDSLEIGPGSLPEVTILPGSKKFAVWIGGGTNQTDYSVVMTATSLSGRVVVEKINISVKS